MICVAADSGPLIMFARSGLLALLRQVAGEVLVPATVFAECTDDATKPGVSGLSNAAISGLIKVENDPALAPGLSGISTLGAGEMMALALADQRGCPVLMDEALGRKVAARQGIPVIGSAGILLAAKQRGQIREIASILTEWQQWGYFLAPALLGAVLARAGESGP